MNAGQIVNMIMRLFLRKVISKGINAGFDAASRRKDGSGDGPRAKDNPRMAGEGRDAARRAKQAMRVTRRMGRM